MSVFYCSCIMVCFLLGSHDSLSFSVNKHSTLAPDAPLIAKVLNKVCGRLLRKVAFNWCVTQNAGLCEQFNLGIR